MRTRDVMPNCIIPPAIWITFSDNFTVTFHIDAITFCNAPIFDDPISDAVVIPTRHFFLMRVTGMKVIHVNVSLVLWENGRTKLREKLLYFDLIILTRTFLADLNINFGQHPIKVK